MREKHNRKPDGTRKKQKENMKENKNEDMTEDKSKHDRRTETPKT